LPPGLYLSVRSIDTKMELANATVTVTGQPCWPSTVTGARLYLCSVPPGEHTIEVVAPDFVVQQAPFTLQATSGEGCCLCGAIGYGTVELTPVDTMTGM
jgi:hypothetical protein